MSTHPRWGIKTYQNKTNKKSHSSLAWWANEFNWSYLQENWVRGLLQECGPLLKMAPLLKSPAPCHCELLLSLQKRWCVLLMCHLVTHGPEVSFGCHPSVAVYLVFWGRISHWSGALQLGYIALPSSGIMSTCQKEGLAFQTWILRT